MSESDDDTEILEFPQGFDISCSGCNKLLYKYPQNIGQVGLKLPCNHYYHLSCFRQLCNEADFALPQCYDCGAQINISDCNEIDYIFQNPMDLFNPKNYFALPDPEGGGRKTKKRRRKTKKRKRKRKRKKKKKSKKRRK